MMWYFVYERREEKGKPFETVKEQIIGSDGRPITTFSDFNHRLAKGYAREKVGRMPDFPEHKYHRIVWEDDLYP